MRKANKAGETTESTRDRIMIVAEDLFAQHGVNGVSMRELTAAANVNLGAINYYFGTKEALLQEIFAKRARPVIERRLALLNDCEDSPSKPPMLEQVLDAFLRPALDINTGAEGVKFMQLRARLAYERDPAIRDLFPKFFDPTTHRFIQVFQDILPHLTKAEVCWRFHFLLGSMIYSMANPGRIQTLSGGICDPGDLNRNLQEMIPFLAAGFRSPSVKTEKTKKKTVDHAKPAPRTAARKR